MNVLKSLESKIASLVEGAFGRVFRSTVRPVELARKLAREMDAHRTVSISRVYAPNEYQVWLSPEDRDHYAGIEREVIDELGAYLLEHARAEDLALASRPLITFHTDEHLALGQFGIQTRLVRVDEHDESLVEQAERGRTRVYRASEPQAVSRAPVGVPTARRAFLLLDGRRVLLPPDGATLGRSRGCDVVLSDTNVSRQHAQVQPGPGGWTIEDLGSTNGVSVNGRSIIAPQLVRDGDVIELGTTELLFEED
jgi:Protein of unknown function (DUF3662)/FHA domain